MVSGADKCRTHLSLIYCWTLSLSTMFVIDVTAHLLFWKSLFRGGKMWCQCCLEVLLLIRIYFWPILPLFGCRRKFDVIKRAEVHSIWEAPEGPVSPALIWIRISGLEIEINRWLSDGSGSGCAAGPGLTHAVPAAPWNRWGFRAVPTRELALSIWERAAGFELKNSSCHVRISTVS